MSQDATTSPRALPQPYFESPDHRFRLYQGDCLQLMPLIPDKTFDLIFADPPYFLSNDGITCHAGKMVSVNKGKWDKSKGAQANHEFNLQWLGQCRRLLKPNGAIWVSGTMHIIHSVGYAMQCLGYKILNDITWVKPNPPPNLSCRYFTHATETILWARRQERNCKHKFHYALMRRLNAGKQMKSVWGIPAPGRDEKVFGKHPTQKPLALLERIIAAASDENDLVFDPFSGSGTTGIAAARFRRAFTGMEVDASFLNVATARFTGVPQADDPMRILGIVSGHPAERTEPAPALRPFGITRRQVRYYRHAARLLGLLAWNGKSWDLTRSGRDLNERPVPAARLMLAETILATPLVRVATSAAMARRTSGDRRRAIACLLSRCTPLSRSTCHRRAQTLLSWISWARRELDTPRLSHGQGGGPDAHTTPDKGC